MNDQICANKKLVDQISDQLVHATSNSMADAWETLCQLETADALKVMLAVICSPDRIVCDGEICEFALRVGAIEY